MALFNNKPLSKLIRGCWKVYMSYNAIDLFSGCGGMTEGLIKVGFRVVAAVENDKYASIAYKADHDKRGVRLFEEDIRAFKSEKNVKGAKRSLTLDVLFRLCFPAVRDGRYIPLSRSAHEWAAGVG